MSKKLWGGRFTQPTDKFVEEFTASIGFEQRLYPYDIRGSKAHAQMLARQEIITQEEAEQICAGLDGIFADCRTAVQVPIQRTGHDSRPAPRCHRLRFY